MRGATPFAPLTSSHCGFQSTLLMRGATRASKSVSPSASFQSTLLMRGATFGVKVQCFLHLFQSTLLMRGATAPLEHPHDHRRISIHAPHARSDGLYSKVLELMPKFQSTLLMRGATCPTGIYCRPTRYFNPRSSCEERPCVGGPSRHRWCISIHAPHARSDSFCFRVREQKWISIHAPHARSD